MRALVYSSLMSNVDLTDIIGDRLYPSGSLGVGDIPAEPERPYVQYGFDTHAPYQAVRETGRTLRQMLRVFVYDDRGDYTRIDAIHKAVRDTVEGLTGQTDPVTEVQCTDALFINLGADLTDNVRSLGVKQASYRLVAK